MLELMRNMLRLTRCQVLAASSGGKALDTLRREAAAGREIDLVLLDIMMPEMDGYEVIARVKADPVLCNTAFIVTTALDSVSDKTLGLGMGADDYLTKPFDPQELLARIDAVMRIRRSERTLRQRNRELATLVEINRMVTSSLDLDEVLEATMQGIREILQVQAGSLVLMDEETGELVFCKTLGPKRDWIAGRTVQPGEGIVGYVVQSGEPQLVNNVERDPHFLAEIDEKVGLTSRVILCVPLKIHDRVIGAIEVINKLGGYSPSETWNYCRRWRPRLQWQWITPICTVSWPISQRCWSVPRHNLCRRRRWPPSAGWPLPLLTRSTILSRRSTTVCT